MNIFVTGATGFIGSHLVRRLLLSRHNLFISLRPNSENSRISDIVDPALKKVMIDDSLNGISRTFKENKINGVIHLATCYRKEDVLEQMDEMRQVNINFPSKLLEIAREYNSTFFINTGTCFEYDQSQTAINESSILRPFNYYASTKTEFENILISSSNKTSLKTLTLRLFFPYGEHDNQKLVRILIQSILKKEQIHVTKGEQFISYTYINDIIEAYLKAIAYINNMEYTHEVINVGSTPTRLSSIFDILEQTSHSKGIIIRDKEYSKNEIMSMFTESLKAKKILGWKQRWHLKEGLVNTYNYYLNHKSYD